MAGTVAILPNPAAFGAARKADPQKSNGQEDEETFSHFASIPIPGGLGDSTRLAISGRCEGGATMALLRALVILDESSI